MGRSQVPVQHPETKQMFYFISEVLTKLYFLQTTFMLLLLLLAKGWAVTRMEFTRKPLVIAIWLGYGIVHILLYVWNLVSCFLQHGPLGVTLIRYLET